MNTGDFTEALLYAQIFVNALKDNDEHEAALKKAMIDYLVNLGFTKGEVSYKGNFGVFFNSEVPYKNVCRVCELFLRK